MYIAHYTTIDTALAKIMPTQRLKLSNPCGTNDPYEVHFDWHAGTHAFAHSEQELDAIFNANEETRLRIKNRIRIACFSADPLSDQPEVAANKDCLWNYYANGNGGIDSGCCVIFDSNKLISNAQEDGYSVIFKDRVAYFNAADKSQWPDKSTVDPVEIFSKKESQWSREDEYRLICEGDDESISNFGFVNTPGSIVGIVLPSFALNAISRPYLDSLPGICGTDFKVYRRVYSSTSYRHTVREA